MSAIPARGRAYFVEAALTCELRHLKLRAVLKEVYDAWKDENHPDLATFEDVNR